MENPNSEA